MKSPSALAFYITSNSDVGPKAAQRYKMCKMAVKKTDGTLCTSQSSPDAKYIGELEHRRVDEQRERMPVEQGWKLDDSLHLLTDLPRQQTCTTSSMSTRGIFQQ